VAPPGGFIVLCTRDTNRLNPENNEDRRNVTLSCSQSFPAAVAASDGLVYSNIFARIREAESNKFALPKL